jgi:hypothetical protein
MIRPLALVKDSADNGKLNDADNKEMFWILDSLLNANPTRPLLTAISDQVLAEQ